MAFAISEHFKKILVELKEIVGIRNSNAYKRCLRRDQNRQVTWRLSELCKKKEKKLLNLKDHSEV